MDTRTTAAAEHGIAADRFAREIIRFLAVIVARLRRLMGRPLGARRAVPLSPRTLLERAIWFGCDCDAPRALSNSPPHLAACVLPITSTVAFGRPLRCKN